MVLSEKSNTFDYLPFFWLFYIYLSVSFICMQDPNRGSSKKLKLEQEQNISVLLFKPDTLSYFNGPIKFTSFSLNIW